jgi:hypothetical protein
VEEEQSGCTGDIWLDTWLYVGYNIEEKKALSKIFLGVTR